MKSDITSYISTQKESSTEQNSLRSSFKKKPSNYDILVIETEPHKVNNWRTKIKHIFDYIVLLFVSFIA